MAEPTTTAAALTITAATASIPVLTILGIPLGIRADWLMAGFAGALVGIVLLDTVPSVGDTLVQMLRTTFKRMFVTVASSLAAGYFTPVAALSISAMTDPILLAVAFVIGLGAQKIMVTAVTRFSGPEKSAVKPEPQP